MTIKDICLEFSEALSDAMYNEDYCWVCKHHPYKHSDNCVWVTFQEMIKEGVNESDRYTNLQD